MHVGQGQFKQLYKMQKKKPQRFEIYLARSQLMKFICPKVIFMFAVM